MPEGFLPQAGQTPPAAAPAAGGIVNSPKPDWHAGATNLPTPNAPTYAPKSFGGYIGDTFKDYASLGKSLLGKMPFLNYRPDPEVGTVGDNIANIGHGLWGGAKTLINPLPENYADEGVTQFTKDLGGSQQDFPILYRGENGYQETGTMAQAQGAENSLRSGVKSVPFVGAIPSAVDAYHDFSHGNILDGAGNVVNTALSITPASAIEGSISKALGKGAIRTAHGPLGTLGNLLQNSPNSIGFGGLTGGELGRLSTVARGAGEGYLPTIGKGFKDIGSQLRTTGGILADNVSRGSDAFKGSIAALRAGKPLDAGKSLWDSAKGFGSIIPDSVVGSELLGAKTQGALLNVPINALPSGLRPAASSFINRSFQTTLPLATFGASAASNAIDKYAPIDPNTPWGEIKGNADQMLNWGNKALGVSGAIGSPVANMSPTAGGLRNLVGNLGIDTTSAEEARKVQDYLRGSNVNPIVGSNPDGHKLYQSEIAANPRSSLGLGVPINSAIRDPRSSVNSDTVAAKLISDSLQGQGISYADLPDQVKIDLHQQAWQAAQQHKINVQNATNPAAQKYDFVENKLEYLVQQKKIPNNPYVLKAWRNKLGMQWDQQLQQSFAR